MHTLGGNASHYAVDMTACCRVATAPSWWRIDIVLRHVFTSLLDILHVASYYSCHDI